MDYGPKRFYLEQPLTAQDGHTHSARLFTDDIDLKNPVYNHSGAYNIHDFGEYVLFFIKPQYDPEAVWIEIHDALREASALKDTWADAIDSLDF